jgi:uncharacterized protein
VNPWPGVPESSYIIYRLPPFFNNFSNRIIKTPKLYFYDTGVASCLLNIRSTNDLKNHFAKGTLFENFIINKLMKNCFNSRVQPSFYFFRNCNGNKVDLIIEQSGHTVALK